MTEHCRFELNTLLNKPLDYSYSEPELAILSAYLKQIYNNSFFEFEKKRGYEKDPFTCIKNHHTVKILNKIKPTRILIVGSGLGVLEKIINNSCTIVSTDISINSIKHQIKFGSNHALLVSDANSLPFKTDSFDVVICNEVLEHLIEPYGAVKELSRIAKHAIVLSYPTDYFWSFSRLGLFKNVYNSITLKDAIEDHVGHISVKKCIPTPSVLVNEGWVLKKNGVTTV